MSFVKEDGSPVGRDTAWSGMLIDMDIFPQSLKILLPIAVLGVLSNGCGSDENGGSGGRNIIIEAEKWADSTRDGLVEWVVLTDSAASDARYVAVLNGLATSCMPDPSQVATMCLPKLSYDINIESAGDYFVFLRGRGQDGGFGAAWAYFDDKPATQFAWPENNNQFRFAENVSTSTTLTAGAHTINLALSEDGTGVDQIAIRTSSDRP